MVVCLLRPLRAMRPSSHAHDFRSNSIDPSRTHSSAGRSRWNERARAVCITATIAARSLKVSRCKRAPATMNRRTEKVPRRVPAWNASKTGRLHFQTVRLPQSKKRLGFHRPSGLWRSAARMSLGNGIDRQSGPNHVLRPVEPKTLGHDAKRCIWDIFDGVTSPMARRFRPLRLASGRKPGCTLGREIATRSSTFASQPSGWRRPVPSRTIAKRGWIRYGSTLRP